MTMTSRVLTLSPVAAIAAALLFLWLAGAFDGQTAPILQDDPTVQVAP